MNPFTKILGVAVVAAALIAGGLVYFGHAGGTGSTVVGSLGGGTTIVQHNAQGFPDGVQIGGQYSSTLFKKMQDNTCNASSTATASFAASTTMMFSCAVPYVSTTDNVLSVTLPNAAGSSNGYGKTPFFWTGYAQVVKNPSYPGASDGVIQFTLYNATGAATTSFAQATTSIEYFLTNP